MASFMPVSRYHWVGNSPTRVSECHVMMGRRRRTGLARVTLECSTTAMALLIAPLSCQAQQGPCSSGTTRVSITPGFFTGAELNSLTDDQLGMYAAGYVDALQAATMIGVAEQCRRALQACATGQGRADFVAAIRKYLRENPNRWDERSNGILYNVLFSQCLGER
jgi:hypothetical protein